MGDHIQAFQNTLIDLIESQQSPEQKSGVCERLQQEARHLFNEKHPSDKQLNATIELYEAIERLAGDSCDEINRGIALLNIGIIHCRLFRRSTERYLLDGAIQSYLDSFYAFYWYPEQTLYQGVAALHLSLACAELEHWHNALSYLQQSEKLFDSTRGRELSTSGDQGELATKAIACLDEQWDVVSKGFGKAIQGSPSRRDLGPHMTVIPVLPPEEVLRRTPGSPHLSTPTVEWITVDTLRFANRGYTIKPLAGSENEVKLPFRHVYAIPVEDDSETCDLIACEMELGDYLILEEKDISKVGLDHFEKKMVVVGYDQKLVLGRFAHSSENAELQRENNKPTISIDLTADDEFEIKGQVIARLRPVPLARDDLGDL